MINSAMVLHVRTKALQTYAEINFVLGVK